MIASGENGPPLARVEDVGVRFGEVVALERAALAVAPGEVVGLVGPNGAGKTTLLRVLATLLRPETGRAAVLGFDVVRRPLEVRRRIGYLPDFAGLYQDMRVVEYLRFFADANGLDRGRREAFVERALELSRLAGRAGDFVERLSRGMRAKLAFVGALAGDPPLLLLDEPLDGLDPLARSELLATLKGLRDEGRRGMLISSHMLLDLERICDRVLLIDRGRLLDEAPDAGAAGCSYLLRASGVGEESVERLEQIEGVRRVETAGDGGGLVLELTGVEAAPGVLVAIVEAGIEVLEWRPARSGLEERYRRAVEEGER
ncbi:MAG: ABC transporter ATP-binding protein [Polyangia bacterium]